MLNMNMYDNVLNERSMSFKTIKTYVRSADQDDVKCVLSVVHHRLLNLQAHELHLCRLPESALSALGSVVPESLETAMKPAQC